MGKYDDARGDAIYEAWRRGMNPDEVEYDRVDEDVRRGFDRFECGDREAGRMESDYRRRRNRS